MVWRAPRPARGERLCGSEATRLCIGNNFALMEGQLLLAAMAQQVVLKLVPGQKIEPQTKVFVTVAFKYLGGFDTGF